VVRKNKMLAIAAVTALLGVTSACGSDDDSPSTSGGPETADMVVWLNGADTPQEARDWLKETFEADHPGSTLTIEEQEWDGLVERLTTALSSEDETPDVVEVGNTQAPTFTTAGAFSDLTADLDDFGGDDLLPGFVDGATVDGKTYAVPYYAGSTYVFYRKDLFDKAGLEVPTTMDEFVAAAIALKADNNQPDFSGYWLPGQDWRDGAAFLWDAGGDFAAPDGDGWAGSLSSPEALAGLTTFQTLFTEASGAPADANESDPVTPFCAGQIGMMSRPGWVLGLLTDPDAGCPDLAKKVGVFALPGSDGGPAPVLLGGSDIAVAANTPNQDLAREVVSLMLSDDYQGILADAGLTPARDSLSTLLGDDEYAQATIEAASNAKLTPAAANWATVEGTRILEDLFSQIAQGGDVAELASDADERITDELN
jgi:N,N'-diacetylchitobiose transport system substrate-binding protein